MDVIKPKSIIIMRGWPGVGKSFIARHLTFAVKDTALCSADFWFYMKGTLESKDGNGEYKFNAAELPQAHAFCKGNFIGAINAEVNLIVVDNTNIRKKHYEFYTGIGAMRGYNLYQCIPATEWKDDAMQCAWKNTHKVPVETIQRMKDEFEEDDGLTIFNF